MARTLKRAVAQPQIAAEAWVLAPSPVRLADGGFAEVASPARALQAGLAASLAAQDEVARWSHRRVLAFLLVTGIVGWTGLILGVRAIFF